MNLKDINHIANIGAGTMGHATALQFAMAGYPVQLLDTTQAALDIGIKSIQHDLATFQEAGVLSEDPQTILKRIATTTDYQEALFNADFVIESVIEDLEIKKQVWQQVEAEVSPTAILA
ncbi:3-hydroxyacyl-CoA dehydrogenase NAD-binding domain-containing protein, partial [Bombilactobacillus bombi]|uniref:3-hydroxyacyl-CoA dehydrogenase NAD-binding domain-containing protein n=1 Tax=Bombilactobacillus bombi TaxID=1303590 RepID=UPI00215A0613